MRRRAAQEGFTLVEVLAAGAVLSATFLCLVRGWSVLDQMSLDLQLRQKAVFALNGEAERLTALYTAGGFNGSSAKPSGPSTLQTVTGYPAAAGVTGSATRLVYVAATSGASFGTTSATTFASTSTSDSEVLFAGSGSSAQDFVWLDRPRNVMARLSWVTCPVGSNTAAACWSGATPTAVPAGQLCYAYDGTAGGTACSLVTLILEYPYRLVGGAPIAESAVPGGRLSPVTLTLSTIVGRRA